MEIKMDRRHHASATNEERIRSRTRNSGSGSYTDHHVQQGSSTHPLHHEVNISEFAHNPTPGRYTSLLNEGLSREAYNGERRRK